MTVLSQVFSVEMAATEPARKLILTPSTDEGSLFMDAPEDLAKRVETLLGVLDQPGEKEERSVKLIKVADAAEVARLQPLVEATVHRPIPGKRAGAGRCEDHRRACHRNASCQRPGGSCACH